MLITPSSVFDAKAHLRRVESQGHRQLRRHQHPPPVVQRIGVLARWTAIALVQLLSACKVQLEDRADRQPSGAQPDAQQGDTTREDQQDAHPNESLK